MSLCAFVRTARWLKYFLLFLLGLLPALAVPPASVAGMVYYEVGATFARAGYSNGVVLNADGTFRSFYSAGAYYFPDSVENTPIFQQQLEDTRGEGTWTYRVLDERRAQIVFSFDQGSRLLTFTDEASGSLSGADTVFPRGGVFKFASPEARAPLVNSSNRSFVPPGRSAQVGFVVTAPHSRVLVRAVGPGLRAFGVEAPLATPRLQVVTPRAVFWDSSRWPNRPAESIRRTGALVGAFPLADGSADVATILTLPPGAYTALVAGATAEDSGEVLIEVYMLP